MATNDLFLPSSPRLREREKETDTSTSDKVGTMDRSVLTFSLSLFFGEGKRLVCLRIFDN